MPDRPDRRRLVRHRHRVHQLGDPRHPEPGVPPHRHRRRAGVALLAGQRHLQPPEPLAVGDDADLPALGLEDRPLLDVQLEERLHRPPADRLVALPADPLQLVAEPQPLRVLAVVGELELVHPGEHARRQHRRREARALLVGPVRHHDRMPRPDPEVVQRPDHLQPAEHARARRRTCPRSAGCRDGCRHRPAAASGSVPSRRANIVPIASTPVTSPAASHQRLNSAPPLAVGVGQRLAVVAARHPRPDLRHLHDRVPEPGAVDPAGSRPVPPFASQPVKTEPFSIRISTLSSCDRRVEYAVTAAAVSTPRSFSDQLVDLRLRDDQRRRHAR